MKSPVVYGNPVMFGAVDWNYAAGAPVRRGKSVEELGDAGWAREMERVAHLQQLQQLHHLQVQQQQQQQQQVGYPGYGVAPPGHPQGPVMVAGPGTPLQVHGGMMVPAGGPVQPPMHVPAQWPVQWGEQGQIRQGNVCQQANWEYDDRHMAALKEQRPQGHDVYYHPGSQDGHLALRISEWKGKHCFYQGPEDQDYNRLPQEEDNDNFRLDEERGRADNRGRDNNYSSDRYDHRSHRDLEEYDHRDKYKYRDHYDRKYNDRYEDREQQYYDSRKHQGPREHEGYNSEYEDRYDRKGTYARRDNYKDSDHYYDRDRDYYDSKESQRYRGKEYYQRRDDDRYCEERKRRDRYQDRHAEDRYDYREDTSKYRDTFNRRGEDTYSSKGRGQYDYDLRDKERDRYRYRDVDDDRRDERYDQRRRDNYRTREHYERRDERENEDGYESRREEENSHPRPRDGYRDLRSISAESRYEDYPVKDRKTHCEEWVEEQNKKLALREMHSFEDPIVYRHSDEQEKGYESSAGSIGSKWGRKPVYVGSLDRNSFYRKTAPSSMQKSQFATTRRQKQGKHVTEVAPLAVFTQHEVLRVGLCDHFEREGLIPQCNSSTVR